MDALNTDNFIEMSGSALSAKGVSGAERIVMDTLAAGGGTIYISDAHQLINGNGHGAGQVWDFLLSQTEKNIGKLVFVFAGGSRQIERLYGHTPGLTSKIPRKLVQLEDSVATSVWMANECVCSD